MGALALSGLTVYPIKSAAGISLATARVDARGLAGDRRWMVVDENRSFLTQRTHPRLAVVSVAADGDRLVLTTPGLPALTVATPPDGEATVRVGVWNDECDAIPAGRDAASWLSRLLGQSCELVYMPERSHRPVAPRSSAPPAEVGFADAYPLLLISEGSLEDLNRRLAVPVPMNRFRPNLVVRGCAPFGEDGWRRIRIGGIQFHVVNPCSRCATTTVDQNTGQRGREPLASLATYRRVGNEVMFGQNLVHEGTGELAVGDEVTVLDPS
jgi:uncharacterized protein YcbX